MENYLHPFITNEDAISLIKEKINSKTPFAFTRFGDGEIHILNRNGFEQFEKKICKQWGYEYPSEIQKVYDDAGDVIRNAFIKSDLIGLMDKNCGIININYKPEHWSLKKDLVESWGVKTEDLQICDHMLSRQSFFGSMEGMRNILNGEPLHIITPYVERMKQRNLDKLLGVEVTYTLHPENINFNNRNSILESFSNIKPSVVVMGIGLQKDYGIILRDNYGKIALDMGATMDAWAGIRSRLWFGKGGKQEYLVVE